MTQEADRVAGAAGTHQVTNQAAPLTGYDLFGSDAALRGCVQAFGAGAAAGALSSLGRLAGEPTWQERGFTANRVTPELHTHDRYGHRIDEVEYHPAWHDLLRTAVSHGIAGGPWRPDAQPGAHVARAAAHLIWSQVEAGVACPITMTYASVAALRQEPGLAAAWEPLIAASVYDPSPRPAAGKRGVLIGMAMTEKQGGSDLRANTTRAEPVDAGRSEGLYRLDGHKWFGSAPMSDGFLVLAQASAGLTCFLLPRYLPDGSRNSVQLQRLKDKLGNRSNASAEIEFTGALAWRVGPEGRGVPTITAMVNLTRLDCVIGTSALIRQATAQAIHHARTRQAFGRRLADQPLMTAVLADLALESEAATTVALRLAAAVDATERGDGGEHEAGLRRLGTAIGKYWVCKRGPAVTGEALECLGGNGYVEESIMPRLYREAPVNSIWEGSGNVNVLDVLRALARDPEGSNAVLTELDAAAGADARLDATAADLRARLDRLPAALAADPDGVHRGARRLVESMALAFQASLLVQHAPPQVAEAFCAARLGTGTDGPGWAFGALPESVSASTLDALVSRHAPGP